MEENDQAINYSKFIFYFAFNLARDFGPRLASAIVFGSDVFTAQENWFWVPMIIPFFGIFGGLVLGNLWKLSQ